MFLKSSVSLKQEIKCSRIIDFIRILYTVAEYLQNRGIKVNMVKGESTLFGKASNRLSIIEVISGK